MKLITFYLFFLLLTSYSASANPLRDDCEADNQCLPGYYCYMVTHYCSPCTNCTLYNRKKKIWKTCAKGPTECDTCLPGFKEDILAGGRPRDWCVPVVSHPAAQKSDHGEDKVHIGWPVGIVFVMITFFGAVIWKASFWRSAAVGVNQMSDAPPPYNDCNRDLQATTPLPVDNAENSNTGCGCAQGGETSYVREHQQTWQQCKEGALQQAVPFRYPNEARSCSALLLQDSDDDNSGSSDTETLIQDPPESNIDLEDDTTMPSDWTPYSLPAQDYASIPEELDCRNDISTEGSSDVVDGESPDITEPPCKKRKEDSDEQPSHQSATESVDKPSNQ